MCGSETTRRRRFLTTVLLALVLMLLFVSQLRAFDLWWHLKAGGYILDHLSIPRQDIFSFTAAGRPWIYHSWLGGVFLHLVHRGGGLAGLVILRSAVISLCLLTVWWTARKRGVGGALAALLVLVVAFQLQPRALTRPYMFSFVLFVAFYHVLQTAFQGPRSGATGDLDRPRDSSYLWGDGGKLIVLPLLMVLWANVHGGFFVGLLLIGAFGVGELAGVVFSRRSGWWRLLFFGPDGARFRVLLVTGVICLAATLINPYGGAVLAYPFRLFREVQHLERIQEWQPTEFAMDFGPFWALLGMTGLCLVSTLLRLLGRSPNRRQIGQLTVDIALAGGFALMALRSVRNVAWFLFLMPPILGYHLGFSRRNVSGEPELRRKAVYRFLALMVALLLAGWHLAGRSVGFGIARDRLPVNACRFMERHHIPAPTYNVYEWGGFLIWKRWPGARVFIDGRCLVYGDEVIGEAFRVAKGKPGWEKTLESYDVAAVLTEYPRHESEHFFLGGAWECVYWDDQALLAVPAGRGEHLRRFTLTNPVMFESRLTHAEAPAVLEELDIVLDRDPECWRAWTFRARALLKLQRGNNGEEAKLTGEPLRAARRAVRLSDGAAPAWEALADAFRAGGNVERAERILQNVRKAEGE